MKPLTFLLVDDSVSYRKILRSIVDSQPAWVVVAEAGDGLAATHLVADLMPDVVLMDANMPIMNGFEAIKEIKQIARSTRIFLFCGHRDEEFRRASFSAGGDYYLEKEDVNQQTLMQLVGMFFPCPS